MVYTRMRAALSRQFDLPGTGRVGWRRIACMRARALFLAFLLILAAPLSAHHSTADYDLNILPWPLALSLASSGLIRTRTFI
jgi:hypothetical protein